MIIRNDAHPMDEKTEMRGGNGTIQIKHIVGEDVLCDKGRLFAQITVKPGCSIGCHEHLHEREIFYVLSGIGKVTDCDQEYELYPGDVLVTGHEQTHSVVNDGQENLEMAALILYGDESYE